METVSYYFSNKLENKMTSTRDNSLPKTVSETVQPTNVKDFTEVVSQLTHALGEKAQIDSEINAQHKSAEEKKQDKCGRPECKNIDIEHKFKKCAKCGTPYCSRYAIHSLFDLISSENAKQNIGKMATNNNADLLLHPPPFLHLLGLMLGR